MPVDFICHFIVYRANARGCRKSIFCKLVNHAVTDLVARRGMVIMAPGGVKCWFRSCRAPMRNVHAKGSSEIRDVPSQCVFDS